MVIKLVQQHPQCKARETGVVAPPLGALPPPIGSWAAIKRGGMRGRAPGGWGVPPRAAAARGLAPAPGEGAPAPEAGPCSPLQVVVLDKLDYCATLNNLAAVRNAPNFK